MTKAQAIEALHSLLVAKVLDPRAALEAAWKHGFEQADYSHAQRNNPVVRQMIALGEQGKQQ